MKYIFTFLAIFLLISPSFERSLRRSCKHKSYNRFSAPTQNSLYQFIFGMVKELANDDCVVKAIDDCFAKIGGITIKAIEEPDNNESAMVADSATVIQIFTDNLVKSIDACCTFKDKIIDILSSSRRYHRVFMQGKNRAKFFKRGFADIWNKFGTAADTVANAVVSGSMMVGTSVNHAASWANKQIKDFKDYVKSELSKTFEQIVNKVSDWFNKKFQAWFGNHPLLNQLVSFSLCFAENDGVKSLRKSFYAFKDFMSKVSNLFSGNGLVTLSINSVCGWRLIKKGIVYLNKSINEIDKLKKAAYRGSAFADFLLLVSGESGSDHENIINY